MTAEQRWFMLELERQGGEGDAFPIWEAVDGEGGVDRANEVAGELELVGSLQLALETISSPPS